MGVMGEEPQGGTEGKDGAGTRGGGRVRPPSRRPAAGLGPEEGRHDGLGTFPGPCARPASHLARWTHSSQSHQPDSPRGRLRRQTAMHRAPPPAPAPQPACAIARPPARSLPRAISRFQGHHTFLSSRRAATGPRNPYTKYRARSTPNPSRRGRRPIYPGSRAPGARAAGLWTAPLAAPPPAGVTHGPRGRAPGEGVMTSRRPGQTLGWFAGRVVAIAVRSRHLSRGGTRSA